MAVIQKWKILPGLGQIFNFYKNFDQEVKILISLTKVWSNFGPRLDFELKGQNLRPEVGFLVTGVGFWRFWPFWGILGSRPLFRSRLLRAQIEISLKRLAMIEGAGQVTEGLTVAGSKIDEISQNFDIFDKILSNF